MFHPWQTHQKIFLSQNLKINLKLQFDEITEIDVIRLAEDIVDKVDQWSQKNQTSSHQKPDWDVGELRRELRLNTRNHKWTNIWKLSNSIEFSLIFIWPASAVSELVYTPTLSSEKKQNVKNIVHLSSLLHPGSNHCYCWFFFFSILLQEM